MEAPVAKKQKKASPSQLELLLKRLRKRPVYCDPECYGRCKECPDDLFRTCEEVLWKLSIKQREQVKS